MRRRLAIATVMLLAVVLQLSMFATLRVAGVAPDVVVVAVAAVAVVAGSETGAWAGFVAGFLVDMFLPTPAGLTALAYTLVGYGVGRAAAGGLDPVWWIAPAVGAAASLLSGAVFSITGALFGQSALMRPHTLVVVPLAAVLSGVVALAEIPLIRRVVPAPRPSRLEPAW